jgi:nucleotide sugar dehydrogenase
VNVAVVGLGKIGLPLAVQYATAGAQVVGADRSLMRVAEVNAAANPFADEEDLASLLAKAVSSGKLRATTDTAEAVRDADVVVIIVPLVAGPDHVPDPSMLEAAAAEVARGAHDGLLVIVETTVPVGTTRRVVEGIANASHTTVVGAFSPERVFSGRIFRDLATYPKIVGGLSDEGAARAKAFYELILPGVEIKMMSNAETAELSKLAETIYRDVNIALANELARYSTDRNVDVTEAIAAANSQPFSHIHDPGAGVGGHCIPHYPWFLAADDPGARVIRAARQTNDEQPAWLIGRLAGMLEGGLEGRSVLVLGLSYRSGVKEPTSSPGIDLVRTLLDRGAKTYAHDPLFDEDETRSTGATPATLDELGNFDALILQATHETYRDLDWRRLKPGAVVVDGRNWLDRATIEAAGGTYVGVGR